MDVVRPALIVALGATAANADLRAAARYMQDESDR